MSLILILLAHSAALNFQNKLLRVLSSYVCKSRCSFPSYCKLELSGKHGVFKETLSLCLSVIVEAGPDDPID